VFPMSRVLDGFAVMAAADAMAGAAKKAAPRGRRSESCHDVWPMGVGSLANQVSAASLAMTGLAILVASNAMMSNVPVGLPSRLR
jgi:hypothetical protein